MKKNLFLKVFLFTVIATLVTFTSCKDYDDDINDLQGQITSLKATVDQINSAVSAGAVITDVTSTASGIKVTLSNGKSYDITNGKDGINGVNGVDGKDGSVVEIGENGNWYIDGVDTELPARGPQGETGAPGKDGADGKDGINGTDGKDGAPGKDGEDGKDGADGKDGINGTDGKDGAPGAPGKDGEDGKDGADGKDGVYYYPNEDGFWYMVDGETETRTEMTWLPAGTITAVYADGVVTLYNVEGHEGPLSFGAITLNNLVLIPDYVEYDEGAIGVLVFNQLVTEDCGMISSPTLMRYRVSPTNASKESIKTDELYFEFNAPKVRANGDRLKSKAQFVSLTDGVLTVRAFIDSNELKDIWDEDRVAQLQLIVPTKTGDDVISDWVTVDADNIDAEDLFLANVQFKEEGDDWADFVFPNNLADTKGLAADHNAVVQIKYDQSFDLIDVVNTIFEDENFDLDGFGLTYKFDLKETNPTDDTESDIVYLETTNDTDQQDFITLLDGNKGTVKSKVYSQQNSRTAIGRTPIVRVQLMNDDCVVKTAYIKINWTEEEPVVIPTLEVELEETLDFNCEPLVVTSTVPWMNEEVYSALGLTKEEFRARYTLDPAIYNANGEVATELGEVQAIPDVETGLTTDLFEWTYTPTPGTNVVTGYIHLMDGDRIGVRVKVTLTITFPEFSLYGLNNTYWKENGSLFTVNPIVYGNDEASTTVDIYADLLNGFLDKDGVYSGESIDIIKSTVLPSSASFVFDETKLANYKYFIGATEYSVAKGNLALSNDKTQLLLGDTVAATIADDPANGYKIYLDQTGTVDSDQAKALVGQRVPVKIVVDQCGNEEFLSTIKSFEVFFIKPIKINANVQGTFTDATVFGSRVSVAEGLTFTDWNNYVVRQAPFTNPTELQKVAAELYEYYDIQTAVWDIENATSNLKLVGGNRVPTPGYKEGPVASLQYKVEYDSTENELVFYNNSGSALVESFEIYVPVTISHKWGSTSEVVTIKVNPASGAGN